jgi:hypothetical protein
MPQNAPGSLSRKAYIELLSFLLKANDFPPGNEDLRDDPTVLKAITIKKNSSK